MKNAHHDHKIVVIIEYRGMICFKYVRTMFKT